MTRKGGITIRRAEPRDADAICACFAQPKARAGTLQMPYPSPEMWRKRLADVPGDDYLLVAEIDGKVVGNCGLHTVSKSPRRKHVGTIGISVHDAWHGRGVGRALLAAAIDIADNWIAYTRLELTVYTDNAPALALYRKFGFEAEGTHRNFALRDGGFVDALAMARLVPGPADPALTRRKPTRKRPA
jgi:L-phenylalanine/L-methionine N-acetyltransferase